MKKSAATPEHDEFARQRKVVRNTLEANVRALALALHDHPLSIKELMARMLIEDFAALDLDATQAWLDANVAENAAAQLLDGDLSTQRIAGAREQRRDAFTRLAEVEIEGGAR